MPPKVIGIIPSRWAAKRFPGKPLALIAGVPMIVRVIRQALKAKSLSTVVVATDDGRIAREAEMAGATAFLTPATLASGTDRVAWVARRMKGRYFLNIQGDEPVIPPGLIDAVARALTSDPSVRMSTVVVPLNDRRQWNDPNVVKAVLGVGGDALYFSRAPIPHPRDGRFPGVYKHVGIYGYRRDWLLKMAATKPTPIEKVERLEQLRALEHGVPIRTAIGSGDSVAVDVPSDVRNVERFLRRKGMHG
jgi:3-deoxy-manno-octulosonate cytidylyltransferase (CMP-KDO synthetase)